jgi:hypothetical protein
MEVAVGVVTVGTAGVAAHILPFHEVPRVQLPVTEVDASIVLLLRACTVFDPLVIANETPVPDADVEYVVAVVAL